MARKAKTEPAKAEKKEVQPKREATPASTAAGDPFRELRQEVDRLFSDFSSSFSGFPMGRSLFGGPRLGRVWDVTTPDVDVSETDNDLVIVVELPGVQEDDVDVTVAGHHLTIKGEKKEAPIEGTIHRHLSERRFGSFQRSFHLPDYVDGDKISGNFENGVLTVTLPKTPEAQKKTRKIEIKTGGK